MRIGIENAGELNGQATNTSSPRFVRAAQEFEAQMMKELLKPMACQDALLGDADDDGGDAGALGEFASEALGQAISRNGGFGIAGRIVQEISRSGHLAANGKTGVNRPGKSPISTIEY
jgi:Rod binding domain-containing protein